MNKMTEFENLNVAIKQYQEQLRQVEEALLKNPTGADEKNLKSLQSDLYQLIELTKESLHRTEGECTGDHTEDPLEKEYALFQAELDAENKIQSAANAACAAETSNDIEDELKALEGMKCRAPFGSSWGGTGYHNAMICNVLGKGDEQIKSLNDIMVNVLFINPTHKEMLPCPYFLDGSCKFSIDQCHFSHGQTVAFSNLQEYREPEFSNIKMGSRVLAKQKNNLWHRSVVIKAPEKQDDGYRVKFEASGKILEVELHDIFPLTDADLQVDVSDSSDDSECNDTLNDSSKEQIIHKSLLTMDFNQPLGKWEQHTRGMGSKIMAQMGYVVGSGLGKLADGRVQPVEATVLPAGKSLDHCMKLREFAGGDKDLFTAERKMRKQQIKMEQQREKQYLKEKEKEKNNVFNFINATLGDKRIDTEIPSSSKCRPNLKAESSRNLNIESLKIEENISKLEKESLKLMNSLSRHSKGSIAYNNIALQLNERQKEIQNLKASERHIASERNQRKNKAKMSIF